MKTRIAAIFLLASLPCTWASTINTTNRFAYGANIGWMDCRAGGAVIGEFVCSGYLYAANVGWIDLGSGAPANLIQYQNNSAGDFGVNHDGQGNLRGYAYGANIGWINFEATGAPTIDLRTGRLSGYIYGANVGWISLSNAFAYVQTDSIRAGADTDGDSIPDAWEMLHAGNLLTLGRDHDADGDGTSDYAEYLADTDPSDPASKFQIVNLSLTFPYGVDDDIVTWTSRPSRTYNLQYRNDLAQGSWLSAGFLFLPSAGPTTSGELPFGSPSRQRYIRVQVLRPLAPLSP